VEQRVTPYLLYEDGEAALDWLERAFGFRVVEKTTGAAGGLHAELEVHPDGSRIYVGQPPGGGERPRGTMFYVMVDDVDAHYEQAKAAGAEIFEELVDMPFGHRRYGCRDPQGHEWNFAMPIGS
jgi:PhnB protein